MRRRREAALRRRRISSWRNITGRQPVIGDRGLSDERDAAERERSVTIRNPFLWALCVLMVLVFA